MYYPLAFSHGDELTSRHGGGEPTEAGRRADPDDLPQAVREQRRGVRRLVPRPHRRRSSLAATSTPQAIPDHAERLATWRKLQRAICCEHDHDASYRLDDELPRTRSGTPRISPTEELEELEDEPRPGATTTSSEMIDAAFEDLDPAAAVPRTRSSTSAPAATTSTLRLRDLLSTARSGSEARPEVFTRGVPRRRRSSSSPSSPTRPDTSTSGCMADGVQPTSTGSTAARKADRVR